MVLRLYCWSTACWFGAGVCGADEVCAD